MKIALASASLVLPLTALAASPLGTWKTIDDVTGKPKSLVTIEEHNGKFSGKVAMILDKSRRNDICKVCTGYRKNKKIEGMTVLWDMQKDGSKYDGGKVLDPESGNIYSANMKLINHGNELEVRGYIGLPMLGRSQTWLRVNS